jgi:hypothetical protein
MLERRPARAVHAADLIFSGGCDDDAELGVDLNGTGFDADEHWAGCVQSGSTVRVQ